jgi:hypothetical protein
VYLPPPPPPPPPPPSGAIEKMRDHITREVRGRTTSALRREGGGEQIKQREREREK